MQYVANEQQLSAIVHWTFGSLSEITWEQSLVVCVILLLTFPFIVRFAWHYNLLALSLIHIYKSEGAVPAGQLFLS